MGRLRRAASARPDALPETPDRWARVRDVVAVVLLAVTAVLTAWSGFESSKWGGEMSIAFSRASTARIEAARYADDANAARDVDLQTFSLWLEAYAQDDTQLLEFVESRFTPHFAEAFDLWIAERPLQNPDAAPSPFALEEYVPPGEAEAAAADERADGLFDEALRNNQRGDDYTLLTVLFALVLFFAAIAERPRAPGTRWALLIGAGTLAVAGIVLLAMFPKII
ncbi:hypothetical protein [Beutenbergia cavernae]|uniref:hypothetical protein n=1 Tax=Beutenbergia cavernae TaxID=84757 RepID=UPI00019ACECE|nr:hypothetical protein [Beutenbergia cavernae]